MFILDVGRGNIESLAFGPDSRSLAVAFPPRGLLLWRDPVEQREPRVVCPRLEGPDRRVRFSPDGRCLEWRGPDALAVFDAASGERVALVKPPAHQPLNFTAAVVPDGTTALVARMTFSGPAARTQLDRLLLADTVPQSALWSLTVPGVIWDDPLFQPDGRTAVLLERRPAPKRGLKVSVVGRDLATGQEVWSTPAGDTEARSPALSADGRLLAAWDSTHLVIWQIDDRKRPPFHVKNDGRKHFTGIAFHPSGRYLAAASNDTTVKLYDTQTGQMAQAFAWEIGRLRSVAFSPDGCRAAVGSDKGKVLIWDVDL